jgi:hypothetical protein
VACINLLLGRGLFDNEDAEEKDEDDKGNGGGLPDLPIINTDRYPATKLTKEEAM